LLTVAWGLVGLDRFAINPLFPYMMKELGLDYQDIGNLSSALSLSWGVASIVMGRMADRVGRRKIIIPAILVFSAMAGFTALATSLGGLLAMRVVMGAAEGSFGPASAAATIEASKPSRRGLNFGLQQNGLPLIGLALGPVIVTQLYLATDSWRWAFALVSLPGLVVAFLLYKVLRDTQGTVGAVEVEGAGARGGWLSVLRNRNVILCTLILACMTGSLNVVIALTPNYIVDFLKMDPARMGFILSSTGVGALVFGASLPALSDRLGRKRIVLLSVVVAALGLAGWMASPADPLRLFALMAVLSGFCFGVIFTILPLTMESVPAAVGSTAVGIVGGVGEIVGGGVAPSLAGYIANHYGIQYVFNVAMSLIVASLFLAIALHEPARQTKAA
jgi:MFS family permease